MLEDDEDQEPSEHQIGTAKEPGAGGKPRVVIVDFPGQKGYMPLAGAFLIAMARADACLASSFDCELICMDGSEFGDALIQRILGTLPPVLVAFSIQGWALPRADDLARQLAQRHDCLILYGGNHVSNQAARLFVDRPFLDAVANGEGELVFRDLLRALSAEPHAPDLSAIAGLSCRGAPAERPRAYIADLDEIPSPYLSGAIDLSRQPIMIALLETNRGCPYKCSFCYWGAATNSKIRVFSLERIFAEMRLLAEREIESWYICDANFGILKRDEAIVEEIVRLRRSFGYPKTVHTNWAKNANERVVSLVSRLNRAGVHSTFTIAMQSSDPDTLKLAQRQNMAINRVDALARLCRASGVVPRGELIWGLPGESYQRFKQSYDELSEYTDAVSVYPHYILPNTHYDSHRAELGIRTRRGEIDTDYEYCIEHTQMPEADFLRGMRLIISNNVLRTGSSFFVTYGRVAHCVAAIAPSFILEAFDDWVLRTDDRVALRLRDLYRFPLTMHRLSFGLIWQTISADRDGFLTMVRRFLDEAVHCHVPERQAAILRAAADYDCLIFPRMDDKTNAAAADDDLITEAEFSYDFLALQRGEAGAPQHGNFAYRVRHRKGLSTYPKEKWYFGLLGFRGQVDYI